MNGQIELTLQALVAITKQLPSYFKHKGKKHPRLLDIPCGLVFRIWRFHRYGPGSIPNTGIFNSTCKMFLRRSAIGNDDLCIQSKQHQHSLDGVNN